MIDLPPDPPIIQELARCQLNPAGLHIRFDDELQSSIVSISREAQVDSTKFLCMHHAAWGRVDFEFEDERLGEIYRQFNTELGEAASRAMARALLTEKGLIDQLPIFEPGEDHEAVITKLEHFCSIEPGDALQLTAPGIVSVQPSYLAARPGAGFECLLYAMIAVDLSETGLKFGFIGNQAISESNED